MTTLSLTSTYTLVECCNSSCGITFAVPQTWATERQRDHTWWYCPNGHRQHWPQESDLERARRQARRAEVRATHYQDQAQAAERSARAYKGVATRVKRRVANGVCPCCRRTFADLARHMAGQHPDFVTEHGGSS